MSRRKTAISQSTEKAYKAAILRAYGAFPPLALKQDLSTWSNTSRGILHAALMKYAPELADQVPEDRNERERVHQPYTEAQNIGFEKAANALPPALRAIVLLPLFLGPRSAEILTLERGSVERALEGEDLLLLRKGNREQLLPAETVHPLLEDLLSAGEWEYVWQILSPTSERAAYQALYRLVQGLGVEAGIKGFRPHKLRHGFATRMMKDGASLTYIQSMLGHKSPETTALYVHFENKEIVRFLRPTTRKKP